MTSDAGAPNSSSPTHRRQYFLAPEPTITMRRGSRESRDAGVAIEARVARRTAVRRHRRAALMLRMGNCVRCCCGLDHRAERAAGADHLEAACSYADGGGL